MFDRHVPLHIKKPHPPENMSLTTGLPSSACPFLTLTRSTQGNPASAQLHEQSFAGNSGSGEIVEIVEGDVAGTGSNDVPNMLLALNASGVPARNSAEALCTTLIQGMAAVIRACDANI